MTYDAFKAECGVDTLDFYDNHSGNGGKTAHTPLGPLFMSKDFKPKAIWYVRYKPKAGENRYELTNKKPSLTK